MGAASKFGKGMPIFLVVIVIGFVVIANIGDPPSMGSPHDSRSHAEYQRSLDVPVYSSDSQLQAGPPYG